MPHANARLNHHGRLLLAQRVVDHKRPAAHVAKELGVSRQCVSKWVGRYRAEGLAGLRDRPSRPHHSPTRTPAHVEARVVAARKTMRCGRYAISDATGVPARTISRILRRNGLPRLADCDPLTGHVIRASKTTAVRYERDRPGELVHMDVKKIGRIPDGGGWRALGRGTANRTTRRRQKTRLGFDYVHSLVDDHSRLAYSEVLTDEKDATCAGFLHRAAAYFTARGITRIERVMTDNTWAYRCSIRDTVAALGAKQVFIRPHCPWQNGKVERFNRTLQTEWAYRRVYLTNEARTAALAHWIEHYNNRRRHTALGGHPPTTRIVSPTS